MPVDGVSPAAIAFPLFNFALHAVRTCYELSSVTAETKNLLETISQVTSNIHDARRLQDRKAHMLDRSEKANLRKAIKNAEDATRRLEALVERARVDMETSFGKIGAGSAIMWVIRDANKAHAAMNNLAIASQLLQTQVIVVNLKVQHSFEEEIKTEKQPLGRRVTVPRRARSAAGFNLQAPPSYQQALVDKMHERRLTRPSRPVTPLLDEPDELAPGEQVPADPELSLRQGSRGNDVAATMSNVADWISLNERIMCSVTRPAGAVAQDDMIPVELMDNQGSATPPVEEAARPSSLFASPRSMTPELSGLDALLSPVARSMQPPTRSTSEDSVAPTPITNPYRRPRRVIPPPVNRPPYPLSDSDTASNSGQIPAILRPGVPTNTTIPLRIPPAPPARRRQRHNHPPPAPSATAAEPLLARAQPPLLSRPSSPGTTMESRTLIAGHRRPMTLRWTEPGFGMLSSAGAGSSRSSTREFGTGGVKASARVDERENQNVNADMALVRRGGRERRGSEASTVVPVTVTVPVVEEVAGLGQANGQSQETMSWLEWRVWQSERR